MVAAPAPLPSVVGTAPFTLVFVLAEPSLSVLVFGPGMTEVASPAGDEVSPMSLREVLMVSVDRAANISPAEVAAGEVPSVAVVAPAAGRAVSPPVLDMMVVPAGSTTAEEPAPAVVTVGVTPSAIEVVVGGIPAPSDDKLD